MNTVQTTPDVTTLSPKDAWQKISAGELVLIDVRTPIEHAAVHAQNVVLVPLDQLNPVELLKRYEGKTIACICKGGSRGAKAARMLADAGQCTVYNIAGGTQEWESSGLPVLKSRKVIPIERQVLIAAGTIVLIGLFLAHYVNPWWIILTAFVGCGLVFAGISGFCGMALVLAKMPWNRRKTDASCASGACSV